MSISNLTYGSSELRERLVTKGASEIVVMAIKSFPTNAGTQRTTFPLLQYLMPSMSYLTIPYLICMPAFCTPSFLSLPSFLLLRFLVKFFPSLNLFLFPSCRSSLDVTVNAIRAIVNLAGSSGIARKKLVAVGGCVVIVNASKSFPMNEDITKQVHHIIRTYLHHDLNLSIT